jgi:23S rRNA (uracil1939-C5)-methyltransferase
LQHISYEHQLSAKQKIVQQAIKHIGGLSEDLVAPPIGARNNLHYRNKVQFPVKHPHGSQRILAGYYQQDSHELVNIKFCPIQPELLDSVLAAAKELCEENKIPAYDEEARTGVLRHITARYSWNKKQVLVTFVVNCSPSEIAATAGKTLKHRFERIAQAMIDRIPAIQGVCLNFNNTPGNRIMGPATACLAGEGYVEERLATGRLDLPEQLRLGISYRLSPTSFFQINSEQAIRLFEEIYDAATDNGRHKPELVLDAYAGVGAIALWLAAGCLQVIAIEESEAAVADGITNLRLNGIENVQFRMATVEAGLKQMYENRLIPDVVVVDPPRKGLSVEAIEALLQLQAPKIVYVSCNPATLARDLKALKGKAFPGSENEFSKNPTVGYKAIKIQPVDLFPHTHHIESVTVLERVENGSVRNMEEA